MDDRYSYPPNYPPRNDLITDFGSITAMDNLDSMSPYVYPPPHQYNQYQYVPPVGNPPTNSSLYSSHSSFTPNGNGLGNCGNGLGIGGDGGGDLNNDSFYSSNVPGGGGGSGGGGDSFGDEPPLLEELGLNFDQFMAKTMLVGNPFNSTNNNSSNDNDLGDLLIDKEDSLTRSPNSPTSNLSPSNETNHQSHHHLPSSENNYVDDRSIQVIYSENNSTSNHICDNLIVSSNNQQHGNNNGNGIVRGANSNNGGNDDHGQDNRSDSNEDNQLISSWEKPMPDELNYSFDSRIRSTNNLTNRFNGNSNLNHSNNNNLNVHPNPPHLLPKLHTIGSGQFMNSGHSTRSTPILNYNQHHRQILPTLQPTTNNGTNAAAAFTAYPSYQRPIAIQPNLGYTHKVSPRLISPYMTTNVGGREIIFWRAPLGKMYQQQTTTSSTPPGSHHHPHLGSPSLSSLQESTSPIHGRMPIMISASRVSFTNSPLGSDDSSSPSSSCSTSSSSSSSSTPSAAGITMDKKLYMNNPLLVNMLTCPQIPGLRNLAPAPDSSSSHLDEKSKSEILSGLIDVASEKRKRSHRSIATTNREPIKREMRPKIFDIEQFKIGMFHVQSSNEGLTRRNSSTQLKVIFSKRRFIYEFAFPGSYTCDKKDQNGILSVQSLSTNSANCGLSGGGGGVNFVPDSANNNTSRTQSNTNASTVVYYVIAVPFEHVTGLNIDESTMYLTVNRVPALFGGTSVRSKVLFEKAPRFDPSQGEIESNGLHCIHLRSSQVGRLRSSLIEFDKKFADLLSNKIDIDPFSYRCKLTETSEDSKEDEKDSDFPSRSKKLRIS
ncbi:GATA zinc finger domain-containing protein 7-like [Panonychus citri]|uniref:GATA zinc finger domain-containing protein 7-like n=1 Tax=Panonychus citri TaxID=50023 RepID=UPI0023079565|nr:GATA zinc finger domain-containing protein 7-like [Panonychus citri]